MINSVDMQLKLLNGDPLPFEDTLIHSVSLAQINQFGYLHYNHIVGLLCMDDNDAKTHIPIDTEEASTFLLIFLQVLSELQLKEQGRWNKDNESIHDPLIAFLSLIFQYDVSFDPNYGFKIGSQNILYENNFGKFREILRIQNCLSEIEEEIENPDNEMTRHILFKRKQAREKLKKARSKTNGDEENAITMADLVSIFAEAEHLLLFDVFKYDIYQFNDQFNRMKIFEDYHVNIQALLSGAKKEDVKLKHWLSKINQDNE